MARVHDVAALLIEEQHAADRSIDKMQLQKLLYLVQGACLRLTGHLAFTAPFVAYKHGPVIEQVEVTYRAATVGQTPLDDPLGGSAADVDEDVREVVDVVLGIYGGWTGPNLERLVKRDGSPWRQARGDLPPAASSREPIPDGRIAAWFLTHSLDPANKSNTDSPEPPDHPDPDDSWFWDESWQAGEATADEEEREPAPVDTDGLLRRLG